MGLTSWSSTKYLYTASGIITAYPLMLHGWANIGGNPAETGVIVGVGLATNTDDILGQLGVDTTSHTDAFSRINATFSGTGSSTAMTTGTWFALTAQFLANNSKAALLNGAGRTTDGTVVAASASTQCRIGLIHSGTSNTFPTTGGIAEVSMWNGTGMTAANMNSLAVKLYNGGAAGAGGNPLNITAEAAQPWTGKLVAYWPLTTVVAGFTDATGNGNDMSMQGTLTDFGSHPTVDPAGGGTSSHRIRYRLA